MKMSWTFYCRAKERIAKLQTGGKATVAAVGSIGAPVLGHLSTR